MNFEDEIRTALDGATSSLRQHLEADLRAFAQMLTRASAEERQQAVVASADAAAAQVRARADAQMMEVRAEARRHAEQLTHDAEVRTGELSKALEDLRAHAQQELEAARILARAEIDQANAEVEKAHAETEAALIEVARARDETAVARAEAQNARADAERVRGSATSEIARARADADATRTSVAADLEEAIAARLTAASMVSDRRLMDEIERVRTDSHQSELSRAARLADAFRNLDEALGLSEVLERLAHCAAAEVERAAVLIIRGERLTGWRLLGFPAAPPDAQSIDLSADEAGLAGAVLRSGVAASRPADGDADQPALPPFADNSGARHAMALPVWVGGEVVAVLYGDAPRVDTPSADARWPAVLEVLVRHAGRVLEAMTVQRAVGLSLPRPIARAAHAAVPGPVEHATGGDEDTARRYARLLLSEIRMYNEPLVDAGRRSRDLMSRLGGEIERARRLYEARVPQSVLARSEYFDQELLRTLADGDRTLLGGTP